MGICLDFRGCQYHTGPEHLWMKCGASTVMPLHVLGSLWNFTRMWKGFLVGRSPCGMLQGPIPPSGGTQALMGTQLMKKEPLFLYQDTTVCSPLTENK